ncbi:hypothetical protein N9Q94_02615 [Flavobacteriaceae bacterium]|nr:hypothetical protein [Flavobacteriaceae bacterium]
MKNVIIGFLLAFSIFCLIANFLIFKSLRGQHILKNKDYFTTAEVDSLLPFFPNVSTTSVPIDLFRATAAFNEGEEKKGYDLVFKSIKANPYTHYPDLVLSKFHQFNSNKDSSLYYAKKAFYGWPKSLEHFSNYLKLLAKDGDTTQIIEAAKFVSKDISDQAGYISILKMELNNAKFFHLVTSYPDAKPVNKKQLIGKWNRSYNFKGSKPVIDSTIVYSFQNNKVNIVTSDQTVDYKYKLKGDSLYFFFDSQPSPFYQIKVSYSDQMSTLIFENIKIKNGYQSQYFTKSNEF